MLLFLNLFNNCQIHKIDINFYILEYIILFFFFLPLKLYAC